MEAGAIGHLFNNVSVGEPAQAIGEAHAVRPTLAPETARVLLQASRRSPKESASTSPTANRRCWLY
jgi:DNA-binding NarL/FixJ family response regulator